MDRSKGMATLLPGIVEEMHIQSSVEGRTEIKRQKKNFLIVILCVMRRYGPDQYSRVTHLFEREVHYALCHEVPKSWPRAILIS